jgi:hypothetical protein
VRAPRADLGWLPALSLAAAVGIASCTAGNALARSGTSSSQLLFWLGLALILVPIVARLTARDVSRGERVALLVVLGVALYLVKVVQSPFVFTYSDELVHVHNVHEIVRTHHLFGANSILPVTPHYPGLEATTAALVTTAGIGSFAAGLVVVGVARVVMMVALFVLFERVTGSRRVAGLATAAYTANANFLFFDAQFSYESLALPLLLFVLASVVTWEAADRAGRRAWSVAAVAGTAAVVVTHHLTSYALAVVLVAVAVTAAVLRRESAPGFARFAVFAAAGSALWLVVVASSTAGYLTPVIARAFTSTIRTLTREEAPRQLFEAAPGSGGYRTPFVERAVGLGSIALLAAAVPFGLRRVWRSYRRQPVAIVLSFAAIGFFAVLVLRLTPAAWESANRSSEFLFIGLALVVALAGLERLAAPALPWLGRAVFAGGLAVVFAGGIIAGWSPGLRVSQPLRISAGGTTIEPEGLRFAKWAATNLGSARTYAASDADARLLLAYAQGDVAAGTKYAVEQILQTPLFPEWQVDALRRHGVRFVVVDRRRRSFDSLTGYYFPLGRPAAGDLLPRAVERKFERLRPDRIYTSGAITVYDMGPAFGR